MMTAAALPERRRQGLGPRVARAAFPVRRAIDSFLVDFPCNVIGHRWVELRGPRQPVGPRRMVFRCRRCSRVGGFSN